MQISKFGLFFLAASLCAVSARAGDNQAQSAARAALLEKMNEMDTQTAPPPVVVTNAPSAPVEVQAPPAATPPPAAAPAESAPAMQAPAATPPPAAPAPAMTPPPEVTTPAPAPVTAPPPAATAPEPEKMTPVETAKPAPKYKEKAARAAKPSGNSLFEAVPPPSGGPSFTPSDTTPSASPGSQPQPSVIISRPVAAPSSPTQPESPNLSGSKLGLQPIEAPPLPISADKQARLAALLEQYNADSITPEQYQQQRAKILAEP